MRLPAATSSSGMLTKWCPARAIAASTSGRINDPPSTVIVPWQLMTVVTPSSSYTLPVCPKPERAGGAAADDEPKGSAHTFREFNMAPANDPTAATKLRRRHFVLISMDLGSLVYLRRLICASYLRKLFA